MLIRYICAKLLSPGRTSDQRLKGMCATLPSQLGHVAFIKSKWPASHHEETAQPAKMREAHKGRSWKPKFQFHFLNLYILVILFFILFCFIFETGYSCIPSCPGTHYVHQSRLDLIDIHLCLHSAEIKDVHQHIKHFIYFYCLFIIYF